MQPMLAFLSGWELVIVALVFLLLFGHRLPGIMRSMGMSVIEFKKGIRDIEEPGDENHAPRRD